MRNWLGLAAALLSLVFFATSAWGQKIEASPHAEINVEVGGKSASVRVVDKNLGPRLTGLRFAPLVSRALLDQEEFFPFMNIDAEDRSMSGLSSAKIELRHSTQNHIINTGTILSPGEELANTFQIKLDIFDNELDGEWLMYEIKLRDRDNNVTVVDRSQLLARGFPNSILVDNTPPIIEDIKIPVKHDYGHVWLGNRYRGLIFITIQELTEGLETAAVHIRDDREDTVEGPKVFFEGRNLRQFDHDTFVMDLYTARPAVCGNFTFGTDASAGRLTTDEISPSNRFLGIYLRDYAGNGYNYTSRELAELELSFSVTVFAPDVSDLLSIVFEIEAMGGIKSPRVANIARKRLRKIRDEEDGNAIVTELEKLRGFLQIISDHSFGQLIDGNNAKSALDSSFKAAIDGVRELCPTRPPDRR